MTPPPPALPLPTRAPDPFADGTDRLIAGLRSERRAADDRRLAELMGTAALLTAGQ